MKLRITDLAKLTLAMTTFIGLGLSAQTVNEQVEPVNTSSTSLEATTTKSVKKVDAVFATEFSNNFDAVKKNGGADTESALSLSYRPNSELKVGITQVGNYTFVGEGEDQPTQDSQEFMARDLSFWGSTEHAGILGTEKTPVKYLFNLPTSKASKAEKRALTLGSEITLSYLLGNGFSTAVLFAPGWGFVNEASDILKNQTIAELRYNHTPKFSSYGYADHFVKMRNDQSLPKMKEVFEMGVGVSYSPNKVVDLDLSVARTRHLMIPVSGEGNKTKEFSFNDAKEISYAAGAVVKF